MRRLLVVAIAVAVLALAATASARVIELGSKAPPANPECPSRCEVLARLTGYQGRKGPLRNPFVIPRSGYIVAFTIKLARPSTDQIEFFNNSYGASRARLTVLRRDKRRRFRSLHRVIRQSRTHRLRPFFGSTVTFVITRPLRVRPGYRVALTVPTWAPALATGLGRTHWWRASRRRGTCGNVTQRRAHQRVGSLLRYSCDYFRARVTYTATYIPDPRPRR
jgi:hypothetical protein